MQQLSIESFIASGGDLEGGQYRVLSAINAVRASFSRNHLYPTLSDLISLYRTLNEILRSGDSIREALPRRVIGLDYDSRSVIYDSNSMSDEEIEVSALLMRWGLPILAKTIEEGMTIYNFVEEQATLQHVGLVPPYTDEGYLLVPDLEREELHVIRYEVSIFTSADQKFRNLKTVSVATFPLHSLNHSPWHVKQLLMNERKDLPNPATYSFATELDMPFHSTLLPIAKRKLLGILYH